MRCERSLTLRSQAELVDGRGESPSLYTKSNENLPTKNFCKTLNPEENGSIYSNPLFQSELSFSSPASVSSATRTSRFSYSHSQSDRPQDPASWTRGARGPACHCCLVRSGVLPPHSSYPTGTAALWAPAIHIDPLEGLHCGARLWHRAGTLVAVAPVPGISTDWQEKHHFRVKGMGK